MENKIAKANKPPKKPAKIQLNDQWEKVHPNAAGIDIGARENYACVPPDRDAKSVRRFGTTTPELQAMAQWFKDCGIQTWSDHR